MWLIHRCDAEPLDAVGWVRAFRAGAHTADEGDEIGADRIVNTGARRAPAEQLTVRRFRGMAVRICGFGPLQTEDAPAEAPHSGRHHDRPRP